MNNGEATAASLSGRCVMAVNDSITWRRNIELDGVRVSDGIHVSVRIRMSSLLSVMTSWISAASVSYTHLTLPTIYSV